MVLTADGEYNAGKPQRVVYNVSDRSRRVGNSLIGRIFLKEIISVQFVKVLIAEKMYTAGRFIYGNSDQWRGAFGNVNGRALMARLFSMVDMELDDRNEDDMDTARTMDLRRMYVHALRYSKQDPSYS